MKVKTQAILPRDTNVINTQGVTLQIGVGYCPVGRIKWRLCPETRGSPLQSIL